jgi:hypothetical protein
MDALDIDVRLYYMCCEQCAKTRLRHERAQGYVFSTRQDVKFALQSSILQLNIGNLNWIDGIGVTVNRMLWQEGLTTAWNGDSATPIEIQLTNDDMDYLDQYVDSLLDDIYTDTIRLFRQRRAMLALKVALFRQRWAVRKIERAMLPWALRFPDGCLYRQIERNISKGFGALTTSDGRP